MSQIKRSPIFRFKNYVREKLAQISILNLLISINLYVLHNHILIIPRVLRGLGLKDQGLRLKRICAYKEDFLRHMKEMGLWFLKRSYPENRVDRKLGKVNFSKPSQKTNKRDKSLCLVVKHYHYFETSVRFFHLLPCLRFVVSEKLAAT